MLKFTKKEVLFMKRKFTSILLNWKENYISTPLMIVGARQIGKTYIINDFCKSNFENYVYINLEKNERIKNIFESTINPEEIFPQIELVLGHTISIENTVIFFDEIQVSEKAITSLKYFCESEKNYKIICAGSLLGVKLNRFNSSFPVGKVIIEYMYPMDFEEFLWAIGREDLSNKINECFLNNQIMPEVIHDILLNLWRTYLCLGGMPQVIQEYLNIDKNLAAINDSLSNTIITAYLSDMSKYTLYKSESIKISSIYEKMPAQLAKENKKFNYKIISEYACKRDFETALNWLLSSNLLYKCSLVSIPQIPLKAYSNDDNFKIYLSDIGLLRTLCEIQTDQILLNENFIFKGALVENFVAQTLKTNNFSLYYWKSQSTAEVDFLINTTDGIIPIEVKASDNITSKSLNSYIKKYNPKYAIRLSTKNFGFQNNIKSIPLYATHCIKKNS